MPFLMSGWFSLLEQGFQNFARFGWLVLIQQCFCTIKVSVVAEVIVWVTSLILFAELIHCLPSFLR